MKMKIKMKANNKLIMLGLLSIAILLAFFTWKYTAQTLDFECRTKMKRMLFANDTCNKSSVFEVFFSMQKDGNGYLLVSGSYSCSDSQQISVDGMDKFTYKKEGTYYSLGFLNKKRELNEIFNVLNYENIKIKITELTNGDYIIATPIEIIMLCSKDMS